jgi:hypothetical protein
MYLTEIELQVLSSGHDINVDFPDLCPCFDQRCSDTRGSLADNASK